MAVSYIGLAATAKKLIGDNGTKVRLVTPIGDPVYRPDLDDYVQDYETFDGQGIITNYSEELINHEVIQMGDRQVIAYIIGGEPKPGLSKLEVFNKAGSITDTFQIVNVIPIRPNGETTIAYRLQCRV